MFTCIGADLFNVESSMFRAGSGDWRLRVFNCWHCKPSEKHEKIILLNPAKGESETHKGPRSSGFSGWGSGVYYKFVLIGVRTGRGRSLPCLVPGAGVDVHQHVPLTLNPKALNPAAAD